MPVASPILCIGLIALSAFAQPDPASLTETGHVIADGRSTPYQIRHLPPSSFPDLPAAIADELNQRACLIPQTYEAHRPENVVHASLEHAGSSDWAVLCSAKGVVSLLVFFGSAPADPKALATAPEMQRLQAHPGTDVLGFNWGIDPASPESVYQAQTGLQPRPVRLDHDALVDSVVEHRSVYRFYGKRGWTVVEMPVP